MTSKQYIVLWGITTDFLLMIKVIIDQNIPLLADLLADHCKVEVVNGRDLSNSFLLDSCADALIVRSVTKVNENLLNNTSIKFVGTATAGIDHINTDYLQSQNICFASAPGSNANSVAEYIVYSILKLSIEHSIDLSKTSIGIIGFGHVGSLVGYYCKKLGLKAIVNDPPLYDNNYDFPEYVTHSELQDLLTHCNIISNHVPLSFEGKYKTRLLIGDREFEMIQPKSLFIHTSRGGVVDENSLLTRFLKRDLTYVVDVFENEPDISKDVVENAMIATPHIAGYSFEGKRRGALMMAKAMSEKFNLNLDNSLFENEISSGSITIDYSDHLNLFKILDYSRKLMHTFNDLKETLNLPNPQKSISFDLLRKNYFECRETLHKL